MRDKDLTRALFSIIQIDRSLDRIEAARISSERASKHSFLYKGAKKEEFQIKIVASGSECIDSRKLIKTRNRRAFIMRKSMMSFRSTSRGHKFFLPDGKAFIRKSCHQPSPRRQQQQLFITQCVSDTTTEREGERGYWVLATIDPSIDRSMDGWMSVWDFWDFD